MITSWHLKWFWKQKIHTDKYKPNFKKMTYELPVNGNDDDNKTSKYGGKIDSKIILKLSYKLGTIK